MNQPRDMITSLISKRFLDNGVRSIEYCVADGQLGMKHYLFKNLDDARDFYSYITHNNQSPFTKINQSQFIQEIKTHGKIHQLQGQWGAERYKNLPSEFKNKNGELYLTRITKAQDAVLEVYRATQSNPDNPDTSNGSAIDHHNRL